MKKIILILSFVALNVFAINCREYMQYIFSYTLSDSENFLIDSAYVANGGYDYIYYSPLKYYYTNNNLDSIVRCVGDECWTFKIKTLKEKTESTLKITQFIDDWKTEKIIFLQNDSAITYSYSDEEDKLGTIGDDDKKSLITAPDPSNEYACNITETTTTSYGTSDTTTYQEIITNTENGFILSESHTDEKVFFVKVGPNFSTSISRKNRPAIILKKTQPFDLLGRPIKNKSKIGHTMQVTK